jgi:hypothetical protein
MHEVLDLISRTAKEKKKKDGDMSRCRFLVRMIMNLSLILGIRASHETTKLLSNVVTEP